MECNVIKNLFTERISSDRNENHSFDANKCNESSYYFFFRLFQTTNL